MQKAYAQLCSSLIDEFPGDIKLQRTLFYAPDLESIVDALADSALRQIEIATHAHTHPATQQEMLEAAEERETALHRVLAFFERKEVETTRMRVVRNAKNELRIEVTDSTRPVTPGPRRVH